MSEKGRPHINVHFKCCNVYARVYLNATRTAFTGHCPRCCAAVTVRAAPGGSKSKLWTAE